MPRLSDEPSQSPATLMVTEELSLIRRLRLASLVEGSTLLVLLLIAVPLKHGLGFSAATRFMGPIHGAAFIAYAWCVMVAASGGGWSRREVSRLMIAAFIPFGSFANVGLLRRKAAATLQAGSR